MIIADKMKFRRLMILITALLIVACTSLNSCSEKKIKVYHVGILCGLDYIGAIPDIFKTEMAEIGYIEGENIIYDIQRTNFEPIREKLFLEKFVKDNVDLIFTFPTEVSMAAKAATQGTNIPVLFAIANIEGTGLVDSVRQPGGHITGVRYPGPDLAIKRFEVMCEIAPGAKRMWVPYQRGYPIVAPQMEALHPAAEAVGVKLIEFPADNAAEVRAELDARAKLDDIGFDAILFIPEPLSCTDDAFEVIAKFAYERKLPIGGITMKVGDYQSMFGIDVDDPKTVKQAAKLADKILKGTPAGTIPVVSSESYFEVNYKAAKDLGIDLGEGLMARADRIIR
jgi:putative ABC transport system substrate-binding protein